ncbi:P-II family nitrogen regulator [Effusibacillus pohliae]|uniref:P-II family nitrogen regulator n=1 Tax=Effusibacillus pohliae TaxID=232270 RepID=UPI00035E2F34|nr:P-II family nitrogen regulator [Effusibacillus pohliae]
MGKKVIETILDPALVESVVRSLTRMQIENYNITNVKEFSLFGVSPFPKQIRMPFQTHIKAKLQLIVEEEQVENAVKRILSLTYTGNKEKDRILVSEHFPPSRLG